MKTIIKMAIVLMLGTQSLIAQTSKQKEDFAKSFQDVFKELVEKAPLKEGAGEGKTCKPEDMIAKLKANARLVPSIRDIKTENDLIKGVEELLKSQYRPEDLIGKKINVFNKLTNQDGCEFVVQAYIEPRQYSGNTMFYQITVSGKVTCKCDENSTEEDIKRGVYVYGGIVGGYFSWERYDRLRVMFPKEKPEMVLQVRELECCPAKVQGEEDQDPDGGDEEDEEEDQEDDDDEDDNKGFMSDPENCCDAEAPKQTIGIFPGFSLNDNFENFNFDTAIEYVRDFGTSFGDDSVHGGALVGYMSAQAQGGDVKETMWYAAGLVQNRSPFSFCDDVQWVNQISVQYGEGKIEAFGMEDDFTTFTVNLHTGFNYQFNDNFSIGADVTVASIGNITYKADNGGEDFEQDIGELAVNKGNRVRFGFRFRF